MSANAIFQWLCALMGHKDIITHITSKGLVGECIRCGYETPGWLQQFETKEYEEIYHDMMTMEMSLHGGG